MSFFQFPKDTTSALIESTELVIRLQETIAAQAAVIEKLRRELEWQKEHIYNPFEPDNQGICYKRICAILAIPTDSKQILAEWLDKQLGEPHCYIHPDSFDQALRLVNVGSAYRLPDKGREPLFKKPETLK